MSERSFRRDRQRRIAAEKRRDAARARKAAAAVAVTGAFVLGVPAVSSAAVFDVNSTGDTGATTCDPNDTSQVCELRDAIDKADALAGGDQIVFDSSITGQTITLNGNPLYISDNDPLGIYGGPTAASPPDPTNIYIDGAGNSMVFDIGDTYYGGNPGLTLSGLTVQNGSDNPAGGIYVEEGDVLLTHSTVTGNDAGGDQVDNYSFAAGGGITNDGRLTVDHSTVSQNYSYARGTPYPFYGGGGIDNLSDLTVTNSTITGNGAKGAGGGIFNGWTNYPTSLSVSDSTIYDNFAYEGGGVSSTSFVFFEGAPLGDVGSNRVNLTNSTISGNHSVLDGGGVGIKYLGGSARWKIDHSTISGNNTYVGSGGGLGVGYTFPGPFNYIPSSGSVDVVDSTISGNYANTYGGGVNLSVAAQKYADTLHLNNSTIASNVANRGGGGVYQKYTRGTGYHGASLFSTIVGDNTLSDDTPSDLEEGTDFDGPGDTPFDLSFSLVETPGDSLLNQNPAGSNLIGVDPQLGALVNNGGPTLTQLPSVTSPVVDKGSAPGDLTSDQRGDPRTVDTSPANAHDGTDIGAVELPTGPPGPTPSGSGVAGTKVHNVKKKHKKRRQIIRTKHKFAKIHLTFGSTNPAVTNYKCSLDGSPAEACSSPFSAKVESGSGNGRNHTVVIQAYDANGNPVGKPRTFRFRVVLKD
jgi:hypothetical protein